MERSSETLALEAVGGLWWDWNMVTGEVTRSEKLRSLLDAQEAGHGYVSWIDRVHPDDAARVQGEIAEMLTGSATHAVHAYRLAFGGDGYTSVVDRILVVRDERGRPIRAAGVLLRADADERDAGEGSASVSEEVGSVLRRVCHDLNNARLVLEAMGRGGSAEQGAERIGYVLEKVGRASDSLGSLAEGGRLGRGADGAEVEKGGEGEVDGEDVAAAGQVADRLRGLVVLVVEDTDVVRRLLCESLRVAGCEVLEASDGAEGLAIVEREGKRIDVGVTDLLMPRMGGMELIRRSGASGCGLPWLVLTGDAGSAAEVREGSGTGVVRLVTKPLEIREVREAVAALAGR